MKNLNEASAYSQQSPYEIYQEWEEIPVHKGFIVEDLLALKLGDWRRSGGKAAFVNQDGAGGVGQVSHRADIDDFERRIGRRL